MRWFRIWVGAPLYRRFLWRQLDHASQAQLTRFVATRFDDRERGARMHVLVSSVDLASLANSLARSGAEFERDFADADVDTYIAVPGLEAFPRAATAFICYSAYYSSLYHYPLRVWRGLARALFERAERKRKSLIG